jgi:glycosyltransferase involved in cell wall biosynthesis
MRILNLVAGQKWTGTAAVVFDQTTAMVDGGIEAQLGFVAASPLAERLSGIGWARPLLTHSANPLEHVREASRLADTIRRELFDLVHAHATHDHYVAALAVRGTGVPLVRTFHNVRHVRRDAVSRLLFARTSAFAFANRAIAERFGADGPVHSPVVDVDRFRPGPEDAGLRARFGIAGGVPLVGTVGKMAADRGHADGLAALSLVPGAACFVHVGHGEWMPHLKREADRLGIAARNLWLGYQEEALPELYRTWDAFLFAASGSEQGQRAILEAMASGVPVVAVDVPGVRDLLADGEQGFVVSGVDAIAAALGRLLDSAALRHRMGESGRRRAMDFTGEKFAAKARAFYQRVLAERSPRKR